MEFLQIYTVLEKLREIDILFKIALTIMVIKLLINIKNSAKKNFKNMIFEAVISLGIGVVFGWLSSKFVSAELSYLICAISTWIGSKIDPYIQEIPDVLMKKFKKGVDDQEMGLLADTIAEDIKKEEEDKEDEKLEN